MGFLFKAADRYIAESNWKTLALVKFCLCSMGILLGCAVPEKGKKSVMAGAAGIFAATYIPLMAKLFRVFRQEAKQEKR